MSAEVRVLPRCVRAFSVADSSSYAQCCLTDEGKRMRLSEVELEQGKDDKREKKPGQVVEAIL